jgi:protein-L-isoaspartate(D-aspartate) O-methyltransferase
VTIVEDRPPAGDEADRANLARKAMIDSQLAHERRQRRARAAADGRSRARTVRARGGARLRLYRPAIALGDGRQLAAPVVHGMMLQEARPARSDKVLLVDGGSGYLAELLRPMVGALEVVTPADSRSASRKGGDFTCW